jgi:hypothetical protein
MQRLAHLQKLDTGQFGRESSDDGGHDNNLVTLRRFVVLPPEEERVPCIDRGERQTRVKTAEPRPIPRLFQRDE